ncbi:MAG: hypothetical protein NTX25_00685 [Proteobacteria bacterium]|nr:hypothetical protein [Pseudomonadota bacterium]
MIHNLYLSRHLPVFMLLLTFTWPALGKGLDSLQADTDKPAAQASPATEAAPANPQAPAGAQVPAAQATTGQAVNQAAAQPNFEPEKFYMATSLSWLNLSGREGGWHSGTNGDFELGYRIANLMQKIDVFGTFHYRPVDVTVDANQRQYRGIVESQLFGAKAKFALNTRLAALVSAELGLTQVHLNSIDSLPSVDQALEKSGVDLNLGAGVSYLVLDRLGVGSRLALGVGTFKTIQFGIDLRFLL